MTDYQSKVPELRKFFLDKYSGNILDDTYDDRDVKRVKTNDAFLRCCLKAFRAQGDVKKAADLLNDVLMYRATSGINDWTASDLSPEVVKLNGIYFKGKDKQGNSILHFKVAASKKGKLVKEGKQFIAYTLNKFYWENPEQQIVSMFDFVDAGVSNMDLDVTKFIATCTNTYFPSIYAYSLMFKMGLTLEAVWKVIKGFLDPEQAKKTYFVKRTNVQDYIDASELEPHMLKD